MNILEKIVEQKKFEIAQMPKRPATVTFRQIVVPAVLWQVVVKPSTSVIREQQTKQFQAEGLDQFGQVIELPTAPQWSIGDGDGQITSDGATAALRTAQLYATTCHPSRSHIARRRLMSR